MRGFFWVLLLWAMLAMGGSAYQIAQGPHLPVSRVKHYHVPPEPVKPFYVFTRAFADSIVIAGSDTLATQEHPMTPAEQVNLNYVRRLLIELLGYLPRNESPRPKMITLEYRPPPTPAESRRQQAEQLRREADRLERAEQLRSEVKQAIAWLDSAGVGEPAGGSEGSEPMEGSSGGQ